jgi:hypothetical protein
VHAQVIRHETKDETRAAMERIVCRELIPALRAEPGFAGAMSLGDPQTGEAMTIVLWKTPEQARRPLERCGASLATALSRLRALSSCGRERVSVWEVSVRI